MSLHLHQAVIIQTCSVGFWEFCHDHVYFKAKPHSDEQYHASGGGAGAIR